MVPSELSLSVVVPVFNEENYIGACLDALIAQKDDIHEVVVVDNNSTDRTVEIVEKVSAEHPFVRVVREPVPGAVHARNTGFDAATGDVLGRIDADTQVGPGWARAVLDFLGRAENRDVGAVCGLNNSYDSPYRPLKGRYVRWMVGRGKLGGGMRIANLHGANMAIRRSTWEAVRAATSSQLDVHEDVDLALCVVRKKIQIAQLTEMFVELSPRRAATPPWEFTRYVAAGSNTYERHGVMSARIRMLLWLHWLGHAAVYLAYRPYDPDQGRFTVRRLVFGGPARTLPVS